MKNGRKAASRHGWPLFLFHGKPEEHPAGREWGKAIF